MANYIRRAAGKPENPTSGTHPHTHMDRTNVLEQNKNDKLHVQVPHGNVVFGDKSRVAVMPQSPERMDENIYRRGHDSDRAHLFVESAMVESATGWRVVFCFQE